MAPRRTIRTPTPARVRGGVGGVAGPLRRVLTGWLAILGLLVQLSAAAACTMGSEASGSAMDVAAFPLCHGRAADDGSAHGRGRHRVPDHPAPCPFCALHCHAALASPPVVETTAAVTVTALEPPPARPSTASAVRVCAGASPRGPPRA